MQISLPQLQNAELKIWTVTKFNLPSLRTHLEEWCISEKSWDGRHKIKKKMYFMIAIFTPDLKNLIDTKMSSAIHY